MSTPSESLVPLAVLGATGLVGQRLLLRLARHPWFRIGEVWASARSAGRSLGEALPTDVAERLPPQVRALRLQPLPGGEEEPLEITSRVALSALPSAVARRVEPRLAAAGVRVVSNASAFRADPSVPLVIPEVNPDHLELLAAGGGGILTNPNCAVIPLTLALAPLHRAFQVERMVVTTFQAVSGAGTRGPTTLELSDNVLPVIGGGEEEKLRREPGKLLGRVEDGAIRPAELLVSATTTRVPVLHGHLVDVSVAFRRPAGRDEVLDAWTEFNRETARGIGGALPSLPGAPLHLALDPTGDLPRPQPRLDRERGEGMTVTVGRLRPCPVHHVRFMAMAHNLERGAAGAAVANAELGVARGWIPAP